jgi:threonine/homoserine/homoserine lactone efflux protein
LWRVNLPWQCTGPAPPRPVAVSGGGIFACVPSTRRLIEFVIASFVIILLPGPSVLFTVARAVAWGRTVAVMTVLGNAIGMLTLATLIAFGFGPLLQRSALLYDAVQWAGGAYLIWLGIDAVCHRELHAADMLDRGPSAPSLRRTLREGFVVGILNPKAIVFFAAVFPQFVNRAAGHVPLQLEVLGFIFVAIAILSDGTWGIIAGTIREWLAADSSRLVRMRTAGGVVMMLLGVAIIMTAKRP